MLLKSLEIVVEIVGQRRLKLRKSLWDMLYDPMVGSKNVNHNINKEQL
jgi:hypothetical protein